MNDFKVPDGETLELLRQQISDISTEAEAYDSQSVAMIVKAFLRQANVLIGVMAQRSVAQPKGMSTGKKRSGRKPQRLQRMPASIKNRTKGKPAGTAKASSSSILRGITTASDGSGALPKLKKLKPLSTGAQMGQQSHQSATANLRKQVYANQNDDSAALRRAAAVLAP
jgi:putative effector of murein hydrolase